MWCKLWSWFLNTFTDVIDAVAYGVKTVGTVAAEVLTVVADGVGNAIGSIFGGSNLMVWIVGGLFAYAFLMGGSESKEEKGGSSSERIPL